MEPDVQISDPIPTKRKQTLKTTTPTNDDNNDNKQDKRNKKNKQNKRNNSITNWMPCSNMNNNDTVN